MGKIMYRCDNCGRFISERDFDHGATRKKMYDGKSNKDDLYETICVKCNKMPLEAS